MRNTLIFSLAILFATPALATDFSVVKDPARRAALQTVETTCAAGQWTACHLARAGLADVGLTLQIDDETGDPYYAFKKDPRASAAYQDLMGELSALPDAKRAGFIGLVPDAHGGYRQALPVLDPSAETDEGWKLVAAEFLQNNFQAKGITYDVSAAATTPSAERARWLAVVYAQRKDAAQAYAALEAMRKRLVNAQDRQVFNATRAAVLSYLK